MARSSTPTCCLTLPLKLEKWQEDRLAKRFEVARQIYNAMLGVELKRYRGLLQSPQYRENEKAIGQLNWDNAEDKPKLRPLYKKRKELQKKAGFTEYGFSTAMKKYYKHFNKNIGSNVAVHGIAPHIWKAFEKKINDKSVQVHFKKPGEMYSIEGYSQVGKSGGIEIMFRGTYIEWKGLTLPIKLPHPNDYEKEMLSKRVKYVRILRKPGKTKDRWYVQLALEGQPAVKRDPVSGQPRHPVGEGAVGLDIGPQPLAYSAPDAAGLVELADQVQSIEQEKRRLLRKMDRSRRASNPDNYREDGTIKRGVRLTRNKSKRYRRLQRELSYLLYQQAETRKRQHTELANFLLSLGNCFYVEDMNWRGLSRRAKKTEISEKTGRYKRKKRFGKSIANKAPAALITLLELKCKSLGLPGVVKVPTDARASQYNHLTQDYTKKSLSQRWNIMPDGHRIQRDLYSAFLLQHYKEIAKPQKLYFDQPALEQDYPRFVLLHDQTIQQLSALPRTLSSMGIRRSIS